MPESQRTVGVIFAKCDEAKLKNFNEMLKRLCSAMGAQSYACSGYFDAILIVNFDNASDVGKFVLENLRNQENDFVIDTQTFICWDIL